MRASGAHRFHSFLGMATRWAPHLLQRQERVSRAGRRPPGARQRPAAGPPTAKVSWSNTGSGVAKPIPALQDLSKGVYKQSPTPLWGARDRHTAWEAPRLIGDESGARRQVSPLRHENPLKPAACRRVGAVRRARSGRNCSVREPCVDGGAGDPAWLTRGQLGSPACRVPCADGRCC